jgi:hypothetical protein
MAAVLSRFIDQYVNGEDPGNPRFEAFVRTCVSQDPAPGDDEALAYQKASALMASLRAEFGAQGNGRGRG